ncbi:hypothetical protein FIV42_22490 [Persicimonas caeni]|uniref:Uncharacterized protein n=1 Tax=Persicimonas caeni TaxID=2292766 RepID=A0A4Y6PYU8_PERCE|nr:hypothetical protein [Persicimonas caeni]QDG53410.1 hypothetical protein FIV42_22490 [Persicimonas caeni]QED34631.1 hypothetical protein FRD00_22485 [Persicimonas caeni]
MDRQQLLHRCRMALAINRLEQRIDHTLDQCRRFDQMAEPLETWATQWSTATLERWLNLDNLPLEEREKALVALALQATEEAGAILRAYDPAGAGQDHVLFHQVACIEWEQRHRARGTRAA